MRAFLPLSIITLSIVFFSCKKESKYLGYVDENEALVEKLEKINGDARTYNYDFKILENPKAEGVNYYKPTLISEALTSIPEEMEAAIHLPSVDDFPFTTGTEKANIVTFWNRSNKLVFQIQIAYLEEAAEYKANNQDFFIISATQLPDNPFIDTASEDDPIDKWIEEFKMDGPSEPVDVRIYQKLELTPELPLFYKDRFRNWSTMYPYYSYDESKNYIEHTSTGASIYYAWHDGLIFQIGYKFTDDTIDVESLVRKIILGS
ncbi:hypothetical protein EO244_06565 [Ancylomarina salipaludis]|uniref:Uncharacterized protein n=1 Tax=Ancylomarina salipaludis TaxID=2501299 RepID=A0A4Q1JMW9_9BACT|nr:hypothetical protein [Ancylomarina salipaludis]RXQ95960.1 hypothetical protein EO244_06565 [Ancylomarina salipaludis]